MPRHQVRVGFVGCGLIARAHLANLANVDGVEIGPVHDRDGERAQMFAALSPSATVVASAAKVVADCEAVYICTWTAAHPETVSVAAAAGRAVFCEKPLAVDLATAEAMTEMVESSGVVNQVGLVLRHSPAFRWLRHQIADEAHGPVMNIVFRDDQYLPVQGLYGSTWRSDKAKAGAGVLLEHSIHDLDLLRWMMGPIDSVSARTGFSHGLDGIEDQASVLLVGRSGAQATLVSLWHDVLSRPSQRRVEVFCQQALMTLTGDWTGPVTIDANREPGPSTEHPLTGPELAAVAAAADGLGTNPDADFIASVASGKPAYPDFRLALDGHRLADAIYRSAAAGGQPLNV